MKKGDLVSVHAKGSDWWEHGLYAGFTDDRELGDPFHMVLMEDDVFYFTAGLWEVVPYTPERTGRYEE